MQNKSKGSLLENENKLLKQKLAEAEETLNAIRNGEVDAIVVTGNDGDKIFSLTSAEKPYRHVIEEMQEGAVTISEEGTILYCNRSFEELMAMPMEKIVGANFRQFVRRRERQRFNLLIKQRPFEKIIEETEYIGPDGQRKFFHLSICPLPGNVLGKICIIVTDITEIKKYQEDLYSLVEDRTCDLQDAIQQLKESNLTKDKLFSIIAHDLKGPFTSLLGFSELLAEGLTRYDTGQFEMMINNIHMAAKNAYALLENLLLWAMSRNKQLQFNPVEVNLTGLIGEVIKSQKALAVMKNISLNMQADKDIWGVADTNMLKAVIRNLLGNAIKFTHHGGSINVTALKERNRIKISVTDNGIGMSEETIHTLFQNDSNKSVNGTGYEKGTGLGMLICDEFIKKHNGKIEIKSEYGKGSTFTVVLPDIKADQARAASKNSIIAGHNPG